MTENTPVIITSGATFADIRLQLNLSRKDLADLTGLTQAVIWRIEHVPAGSEKDADADIRTTMQTALTSYVVEHPGGKPKAAKKAPKTTTSGFTAEQVTAALNDIAEVVTSWKDEAKVKKSSTKGYDAILKEILEQSGQFTK